VLQKHKSSSQQSTKDVLGATKRKEASGVCYLYTTASTHSSVSCSNHMLPAGSRPLFRIKQHSGRTLHPASEKASPRICKAPLGVSQRPSGSGLGGCDDRCWFIFLSVEASMDLQHTKSMNHHMHYCHNRGGRMQVPARLRARATETAAADATATDMRHSCSKIFNMNFHGWSTSCNTKAFQDTVA